MGATSQLLETITDPNGVPADVGGAEIIVLPSAEEKRQLSHARSDCETLRRSVHTLQRCLWTIEGLAAKIDDGDERERLQRQIDSLNAILLLRLYELSQIDRSLRERLLPCRPSRP